jgi:hypothetical protein
MSWGYKIAIVIVLFLAGMAFMVSIAMKQKNEMIDDQYYVKELHHQEQIDAAQNLNAQTDQVQIKDTAGMIQLSLPQSLCINVTDASISFLRPSDQSKDLVLPIQTDSLGQQFFPKTKFIKGLYRVRVSWKSNAKPFFAEQSFFVN